MIRHKFIVNQSSQQGVPVGMAKPEKQEADKCNHVTSTGLPKTQQFVLGVTIRE